MSKVVVIDWGHGLPDPGAVKYGQEYQYARKIGVEVAKRLPESIKVIYTRTSDKALDSNKGRDLNIRCNIANKARADLFVSIHLNAGGGTGYETLVYSEDAKNRAVHEEIKKVLAKYGIKDRKIKKRTDVRVLNGTKMSACLLECLFIDNKDDMDKLNNQSFFEEFCQAIADGIAKAVGVAPTKPANNPKKEGEDKVEQYKKDAAASPRFREAQKWVKETKTPDGTSISDGTYPQRPITREEVWGMMHRMSKVNK